MEKLAVEAAVTTTYNMHHLIHYIKCTEYLQDKVNHISQAWIDADRKYIQEIGKVQEVLLPRMRKKLRIQPFHVEATKLNFKACPTKGYLDVLRTEMLYSPPTMSRGSTAPTTSSVPWRALSRLPLPVLLHHPSLPDRSSYLFHIIM
jgi:hypothetical protein